MLAARAASPRERLSPPSNLLRRRRCKDRALDALPQCSTAAPPLTPERCGRAHNPHRVAPTPQCTSVLYQQAAVRFAQELLEARLRAPWLARLQRRPSAAPLGLAKRLSRRDQHLAAARA